MDIENSSLRSSTPSTSPLRRRRCGQALTSAEFSRKYFSGNAVEVDLKVGGAFIVRTPDGAVHISGEVIECDP